MTKTIIFLILIIAAGIGGYFIGKNSRPIAPQPDTLSNNLTSLSDNYTRIRDSLLKDTMAFNTVSRSYFQDDYEIDPGAMTTGASRRSLRDLMNNCIQFFADSMQQKGFNVSMTNTAVTRAIRFGSSELNTWLDNAIGSNTNTQFIEIRFGMYTPEFIDLLPNFPSPPSPLPPGYYKRRLTAFLFPCRNLTGDEATFISGPNNGKSVPAFNLGGLKP